MISCTIKGVFVGTWENDNVLAEQIREWSSKKNAFSDMFEKMSKEDKPTWINESNTIKE